MKSNMNWSGAVSHLSQQGSRYVLATIIGVSGSTPRDNGTKMVITQDDIFDTIGGGHLEHKVIQFSHQLLRQNKSQQHIEHFQLGSQLGQCCGGNATVLFECFAANAVNIMVFGAGHVGEALVPILAGLPCHITWVDSRESQLNAINSDFTNAFTNVKKVLSETPEDEVATMPENSYFIVMTHNHQIDFDISQAILKRDDFNYFGLIASDTKWRRFQQRFKHRDISSETVGRMNCPIGLSNVSGKLPMEVAVSIAGEVIAQYQKSATEVNHSTKKAMKEKSTNQGIKWQAIKTLVTQSVEPILKEVK